MRKGGRIVRYSAAELDEKLARGEDQTDWARVDTLTEEELEASIDWDDEGEFDLTNVFAGLPPELRQPTTIRIDADVLDWFCPRSPSFRRQISGVLRSYVDAQQANAAPAQLRRQRKTS